MKLCILLRCLSIHNKWICTGESVDIKLSWPSIFIRDEIMNCNYIITVLKLFPTFSMNMILMRILFLRKEHKLLFKQSRKVQFGIFSFGFFSEKFISTLNAGKNSWVSNGMRLINININIWRSLCVLWHPWCSQKFLILTHYIKRYNQVACQQIYAFN